MPDSTAREDLAATIAELRSIVASLRSTAARIAAGPDGTEGRESESDRELARRALPEIERASRRGLGGRSLP